MLNKAKKYGLSLVQFFICESNRNDVLDNSSSNIRYVSDIYSDETIHHLFLIIFRINFSRCLFSLSLSLTLTHNKQLH